jgi:hypothetical protein
LPMRRIDRSVDCNRKNQTNFNQILQHLQGTNLKT